MTTKAMRGNTLLETIIYIALIGAMIVVSVDSLNEVYRVFGTFRAERTVSLHGDTIFETMIRDIRAASTIDRNGSVLGSHPGVLDIGTKTFSLNGDTVQVVEDGVGTKILSASDVRITNLVFYHATSSSDAAPSEIVTIRMTIESGKGFFETSKQYYGSAVLRGSY